LNKKKKRKEEKGKLAVFSGFFSKRFHWPEGEKSREEKE